MAKQISSLSVVLGATVQPFVSAFGGLKSVVSGLTGTLTGAGSAMVGLTGLGGIVAGAFAALKGAMNGISMASELEQTQVAFTTMLGSADKAAALMGELKTFAAATPFGFADVSSGAKQLIAYGFAAGDVKSELTSLGDLASGIGAPLNDLIYLYGTLKSSGRVTAVDINQFAGRGIPIYAALAKTMGVATSDIKGLVSEGKIGFPEVQAALNSLTEEGGQFGGMMGKQSQTMKGLWSALADNIGFALAEITSTLYDAFGGKASLQALIAFTGTAGAAISGFVKTYASMMVSWGAAAWGAIVSVGSAIYGFVAPIVGQIADVVAANWQSIVATTAALGISVWNLISSIAGAAWSIVATLWTGITAVWEWGCGLVGYQTQETGTTVGSVFQTLVDAGNWMRTTLSQTFAILAFGISNFGTIVEYVGTSAAYYLVQFYNQAEWALGATIEYAKWFGTNLPAIVMDAVHNSIQNVKNLSSNIVAIISNLPGLIAGTTSFSDILTPLTEGFQSTTSALPVIAARVPGELEAALGAQSDQLGASLVDGAIGALNDLDKQAAAATTATASTFGGLGSEIADAKAKADATTWLDGADEGAIAVTKTADAMGKLAENTDKAAASWAALGFNSAEAQAAQAKAGFAMSAGLAAAPVARVGAGAPAPAMPAASALAPVPIATAAPMSGSAIRQMSTAAGEQSTSKEGLIEVVRSILAEIKGMDRTEFTEAA